MRTPARIAIALALGLCCAGQPETAYSQTTPARKTTNGSVSGRVTLKGKGKSGIIVGLRVTNFRNRTSPALKATTDADGNYRITDVPAGNYEVLPMAPAYVSLTATPFESRGKSVILADGENVEDINFTIMRGGVISGKVTHPDGRPVIEERVSVMDSANQRPQTMYGGSTFRTDDRGIYRIYGLLPGRYKVSAGLDDGAFGAMNRGGATYQRVFYPSVTDEGEAKLIELGEGEEVSNIDITIGQTLRGFLVSGRVVDGESGKSISSVRLGLQKSAGDHHVPLLPAGGTTDARGEFQLENVAPGKYSAFMMVQPNSDLNVEPMTFEVVDQNVTGLVLRASKGASLSGSLALEGTSDKELLSKMSQLRLHVYVHGEGTPGGGQSSIIVRDGSFRLGGLGAGVATFQLTNQDRTPVKGFIVARVERDGIVQPPRGLEVKAGEQISGLRIVLLYGTGTVRGIVNFVNGEIDPGMRCVVRLTPSGQASSILRPTQADSRGHFVIEGVPAGAYDLVVNAYIPASRQPAPSARQSITVSENSVTDVVLSFDLKPRPPNP